MNLKIGLITIPVMPVNVVNSRYSTSGLHEFSSCCNKKVNHKKVCSSCSKGLLNTEVRKGTNENEILTSNQQEMLKEKLENSIIEVLGIKNKEADFEMKYISFIQKSQILFPSITKGFRKSDIKTFISFKEALEELNKVCVVKLVTRGLEHLGFVMVLNNELMFFEIPFKTYFNTDEVSRIKEAVERECEDVKADFKEQALKFIEDFKSLEIDEAIEEKKVLLQKFISEIRLGCKTNTIEKEVVSEEGVNPFLLTK